MSILVQWEALDMFRYHTELQMTGNEAKEFVWDKIMKSTIT